MRRIAIINQKGGVGKTTTAVNLAAALAEAGRRVTVIDLDPQAHATSHLGVEPDGDLPSVYQVLVDGRSLADVRRDASERLSVIGSSIDLAAAEVELVGVTGRETRLRDALAADSEPCDFLIMDCPPSLGVLTLNALTAADEVFVPLQPHFLALHGLGKLLETTALVGRRLNPTLRVSGVVVCMYEAATRLAQEVVRDLESFLAQSRGRPVPWAEAQLFRTRIRRNIKLAECPSFGRPVLSYAPRCPGALDYRALAREVMGLPLEVAEPATVAAAA